MTRVAVDFATRADRDVWLRLRRALWPDEAEDHEGEIDTLFGHADARWPQVALLARVEDRVVGLAEASIRPFAEGCTTRDVGYLEGWYVDDSHRGVGVGRALIRAAEDWARSQGCSEMASDADPQNQHSFDAHLACGFEDAGLVRCFRKSL